MLQAGRFCDTDDTVPENEFPARRGKKSFASLRTGVHECAKLEEPSNPRVDLQIGMLVLSQPHVLGGVSMHSESFDRWHKITVYRHANHEFGEIRNLPHYEIMVIGLP